MTIERWMLREGGVMDSYDHPGVAVRAGGGWVKYEEHVPLVEELKRASAQLREALEKYGRHAEGCTFTGELLHSCNCGLVLAIAGQSASPELASTEPQREIDLLAEIRDLLKDQYYCGHGIRGFCPFCLKSDTPG